MALEASLTEILDAHIRNELVNVHTALPGKVVAYDAAKQTADVKPLVKRVMFTEEGGRGKAEELPIVPNVPVQFPRGGGYVITVPLVAGDFVWLMFSEAGTGEVRATGQDSEPLDVRRHTLSYPVAIPGGVPEPAPLVDAASSNHMIMGKDGAAAQVHVTATEIRLGASASDFVALASLVDARIAAIRTDYNAHTHPAPGGATSAPTAPLAAQATVAATLVKAT
jgi:hypothetical protein